MGESVSIFGRRTKEFDALEHALRTDRPDPRDGFLDEMLGRISEPQPAQRSRRRGGLALAFVLVLLVGFGAFGGLGYAKSAATDAVSSTTSAVASVVQGSSGSSSGTTASAPAAKQYGNTFVICHHPPVHTQQPFTITVNQSALGGHLGHGDTIGPCPAR